MWEFWFESSRGLSCHQIYVWQSEKRVFRIDKARDWDVSEEEIIRDKQEIRRKLLEIELDKDEDTKKRQMVFVHQAIRAPWLGDKIKQFLDHVAMYSGDDLGDLYRSILVKEYFTDFPKKNWQVANISGVSEGVIEYRKREAIKLFGILIWKYCEERETEDIWKGVILGDDR